MLHEGCVVTTGKMERDPLTEQSGLLRMTQEKKERGAYGFLLDGESCNGSQRRTLKIQKKR